MHIFLSAKDRNRSLPASTAGLGMLDSQFDCFVYSWATLMVIHWPSRYYRWVSLRGTRVSNWLNELP